GPPLISAARRSRPSALRRGHAPYRRRAPSSPAARAGVHVLSFVTRLLAGPCSSEHAHRRLRLRAQNQLGQRPDERIEAVGAAAACQSVRTKRQHLSFERRVLAYMNDAALRIEGRDGLCPEPFAPRCPNHSDRHNGIDLTQNVLDKITA